MSEFYERENIDYGDGLMPLDIKPIPGLNQTRVFATGATRDADDNKLDYEGFISPVVLEGFAKYMHECRLRNVPPGQTLRASDNWQKGIPKEAYVKSLIRHVMEAWGMWRRTGSIARVTMYAIMFNVMGWLFEDIKNENQCQTL